MPTGRIKQPSVTLLCQQATTSRQRISPTVTVKGFRMFCISNEMDGSDGNMLWNDSLGKIKGPYYKFRILQTMKVDRLTLICEGKWNLVGLVY